MTKNTVLIAVLKKYIFISPSRGAQPVGHGTVQGHGFVKFSGQFVNFFKKNDHILSQLQVSRQNKSLTQGSTEEQPSTSK